MAKHNLFKNWVGQSGSYLAQAVLIVVAILVGAAVIAVGRALKDKFQAFESRVRSLEVPSW